MSPLFQDLKEQVKMSSKHLMKIFDFLEQSLRVEKREQKKLKVKDIQETLAREVLVEAVQ